MYFHFSLSLQTVHRRFIKLECAKSNVGHFHLGKYCSFTHIVFLPVTVVSFIGGTRAA